MAAKRVYTVLQKDPFAIPPFCVLDHNIVASSYKEAVLRAIGIDGTLEEEGPACYETREFFYSHMPHISFFSGLTEKVKPAIAAAHKKTT